MEGRETPLSPTDSNLVDGNNVISKQISIFVVMYVSTLYVCAEELVKKLLPLGFTKESIRKELYYHDNDPDATALKLLSRQDSMASSDTLDGGGGDKEQKNKSKPFTLRSIQVYYCTIHDVL